MDRDEAAVEPTTWLPNEAFYVGSRMHSGQRGLLRNSNRLYHRMRTPRHESREVAMELILLGLVTVALLVYLVYALLQPEKF
ncbi:K(+)-transporting ATPase subunit F [Granulicella arctica]|uniref:K(+)-transporting ATPase subunit F n=1 Tax=Granulicella arctica TaxID=940613 RepID=UPI0021DF4937|nr:K(+)-transporting ATPase subunit F [Granulicella arctica]